MEQFDEIEKLFKQLGDAGNPPIAESHLNDLNKRLDGFTPQATSSGLNKISLLKAVVISVITASLLYVAYNKLSSGSKSSTNNNITTTDNSQTIIDNSSKNTIPQNINTETNNALEENSTENNATSSENIRAVGKHKNIVNTSATTSNINSESRKPVLFRLISDPNTINQTLSENEGITEIKYLVSYKSVNPLIYLDLPNGLSYSYNNSILVVKGTPVNILGKQAVSIKASANNIVDSVSFVITVLQKH